MHHRRSGTSARRLALVALQVGALVAALAGPMPVAAVQVNTATISPTTAVAGTPTSFTVTFNNVSFSPGQTAMGCVRVTIPAGFTLSGTPTVLAQDPPIPPGTARTWSAPTVVLGALTTVRTGVAANDIDIGGRVQVTFTGTAASAGSLTFTDDGLRPEQLRWSAVRPVRLGPRRDGLAAAELGSRARPGRQSDARHHPGRPGSR